MRGAAASLEKMSRQKRANGQYALDADGELMLGARPIGSAELPFTAAAGICWGLNGSGRRALRRRVRQTDAKLDSSDLLRQHLLREDGQIQVLRSVGSRDDQAEPTI